MRRKRPSAPRVLFWLLLGLACGGVRGASEFQLGSWFGHGSSSSSGGGSQLAGLPFAGASAVAASLFGRSSSGSSFSRQLREVDAVTAADAANLATVVTSATAVTLASGGNQLSADLARPSWCTKAEGKVSRVDCWVNSAGIITGVQLTDDMGIPLPGMCDTRGLPVAGGLLAETESIVEIKACKSNTLASPKGYSYLEFWTDGGRGAPITCGALPPKAACEVINAGKVPKWHEAASATKWYREAGYSPYRYRYKGADYDKHSAYDPERRAYNAAQEPAYYQEVFPLSELAPKCNKWGQLSKLDSACWNKRFRPKPRSMLLGITLTMNDYYTCPKHAAELDPLICYVSGAVDELLERTDLPVKVKAAPVECKSDMFHNTTIKFVVKVHALKLHSPDSKQQAAKASLAHRVMDRLDVFGLCNDYQHGAACEEHGVYEWDAVQLYKLPKGVRWTKPGCLAAQKVRHAQELEGYEHYAINWLHDDDVELPAYEDWYAQQQPQQQQLPGGSEAYEALEQGQYAGHQAQPGGKRDKQQHFAQQQEPSYQQVPPVYQQPTPVNEQPLPVYQQPLPVYEQPPPVYQQPQPVYEQPPPVYQQPPPVYQQPPVLYGPAKPQPHGSYASPYGGGGGMQAYTPPQPTGSVWKKPPPEQHPPTSYAQQQHLLQQPVTMLQAHQQQQPPPAYPARVQQQQQQQQRHAAAAASSLPHSSSRSGAVHNSRQGISQRPMVQVQQQQQQQQQPLDQSLQQSQQQQHQAHQVGGGISGLLAGALYSLADTLNSQA